MTMGARVPHAQGCGQWPSRGQWCDVRDLAVIVACAASAIRRGAYVVATGNSARDGGLEGRELVNDAPRVRRGF
jgi:hypothetical protein